MARLCETGHDLPAHSGFPVLVEAGSWKRLR